MKEKTTYKKQLQGFKLCLVTTIDFKKLKKMAKQKGIIKLHGTIGDITFYKSQDGHLAREKGGIDAKKIATDPAFARTRENNSEFSSFTKSGKMLRDALRTMLMNAADNRVIPRLVKTMSEIRSFDTLSARGFRTVAGGIGDPSAKALLKGFNFNERAVLGGVLFKPYAVNIATGEIKIANVVPVNDIKYPATATHVNFKCAWARVNFATGQSELQLSNDVNLTIDETPNTILLTPTAIPTIPGTDLYLLQIEFFQEINGTQYSLKNGAYNALAIVEVG